MRRLAARFCWQLALVLSSLSALLDPPPRRVRRYVVEGVALVPISALPREEIRVPPSEWLDGLKLYVAFHHDEARA